MNDLTEFWGVYYSQTLQMDLVIWFTITDHDPEVGVYYEFEWGAFDEKDVDRSNDLPIKEREDCERAIRKHIEDDQREKQYDF